MTVEGPEHRFYSDDEAEEILRLAASQSASPRAIDRERLLATASELGISPEAVEQAENQLRSQKLESQFRLEFADRQRREFGTHLVTYLIINAFLLAINLLTGIQELWFVFPLLGWGIGLAIHAYATLVKSGGLYRDGYEKWVATKVVTPEERAAIATVVGAKSEFSEGRPFVVGIHIGARPGERNRHARNRRD
ncbi:MAG: 2TM domain-containing protein [Fimbriimonas sp.]|nr:2TM domain-containing protein [Fimbriimonas sp.]